MGTVLEALRAVPGGTELLALAERQDLALVGGAVRDLLLGPDPRELDVVLARDADARSRASWRRCGAAPALPA